MRKVRLPRQHVRFVLGAIMACSGVLGCSSGQIGEPQGRAGAGPDGAGGGPGSGTGSGTGGGPGQTPCVEGVSFAPARVALISDEQYRNIVRDVFGATIPATYNGGGVVSTPSASGRYPYNER